MGLFKEVNQENRKAKEVKTMAALDNKVESIANTQELSNQGLNNQDLKANNTTKAVPTSAYINDVLTKQVAQLLQDKFDFGDYNEEVLVQTNRLLTESLIMSEKTLNYIGGYEIATNIIVGVFVSGLHNVPAAYVRLNHNIRVLEVEHIICLLRNIGTLITACFELATLKFTSRNWGIIEYQEFNSKINELAMVFTKEINSIELTASNEDQQLFIKATLINFRSDLQSAFDSLLTDVSLKL